MTVLGVIGYIFRRLPCAAALLALAGFIWVALHPDSTADPERLPDFDYLPTARRLAEEEKYDECIQLCEDVIALSLPRSAEAERLRDECRRRRESFLHRGTLAVRGFVTGDASTLEAAIGAVVSDMTLYGDVRDLSVQGWRKLSGREIDRLVIALSALGLATELADWADWLPAVLKAFGRAGVIGKRFGRVMTEAAKLALKGGAKGKAARAFFGDLGGLIRKCNLSRSKAILRQVDSARQVKILAAAAAHSPRQLHLGCRSAGVKRLSAALDGAASPARTLRIAARKGPDGLRVLEVLKKSKTVKRIKWGARLGKVFYSRHADKLARHLCEVFPEGRWIMLALAALSAVWGVGMLIPKFLWRRIFRRRVSGRASAVSDARTKSETPEAQAGADPAATGRD